MKLSVDQERCMSTALCTGMAPEVLEIGADGSLIVLIDAPGGELADDVRDAVRMCPFQALLVDED